MSAFECLHLFPRIPSCLRIHRPILPHSKIPMRTLPFLRLNSERVSALSFLIPFGSDTIDAPIRMHLLMGDALLIRELAGYWLAYLRNSGSNSSKLFSKNNHLISNASSSSHTAVSTNNTTLQDREDHDGERNPRPRNTNHRRDRCIEYAESFLLLCAGRQSVPS